MADDTTAETRDLETDIDWLKLERAETWIDRLIWLAPAIVFSAIFLIHVTRSRLCWAAGLFIVPFLSALCLSAIRSVFVELKDHCCRLDKNLKAVLTKLEELESRQERR